MAASFDKSKIESSYGLFIDGKWVEGSEKKTLDSYCPANGEKLASFVEASREDVDQAVAAAQKAFQSWKKTTAAQRSEILLKIAQVIDDNAQELAMIESLDNGKPIRETLAIDVPFSSDHFRYFAGVIRGEEDRMNQPDNDTINLIVREPIGVVGQIVPWNFPFLMSAWKLAPALAAGDTVVIHPSSSTPLSLLALCKKIGHLLPPGVLNVVTGKGSISGDCLRAHKGLNKVAFTGSTEIGRKVALGAAENLIPATLELGGKSANIFFEDMPYDKALEGAQLGILFNQGQVCCAGSRIFVQDKIYDRFVGDLVAAFEKIKIGMPWDPDTQLGSQINQGQLDKILRYMDVAKKDGAKILCGGERADAGDLAKGSFMKPTLLEGSNTMCVAQEEIFGPVATVIKFKDEDEVVELANDSVYGLGGAVWTQNINRAFRVAKGIQTGRVWVNTYNQIPAGAPFGGYKQSGIGRETHKMILDAYTQTKNIMIHLSENRMGFY